MSEQKYIVLREQLTSGLDSYCQIRTGTVLEEQEIKDHANVPACESCDCLMDDEVCLRCMIAQEYIKEVK